METRGVKTGTKRKPYVKYTDEEIIDALSRHETIFDLRASEDLHFYFLAKRRGLGDYLPARRTRCRNLVGSALERRKEERLRKKEEKARAKEEKEAIRIHKSKSVKDDKTVANRMYRAESIDEETIYCGRCLNETKDISKHNTHLCRKCYSRYLYLRKIGHDTNPHNVKDEYCHIEIKHHEKLFHIGIKADEKTEDYLTRIGYGFIFKSRQH